ncbi:Arc family DNA-binding protein [Mangrovicella endophytica]|uniref:Arc family DNA-binding protein n=1 Tax=Mangrovicella endophytica TaxID=2066697 RepID=UPI001FDFAACF|nr:Arc family DNA-binding protein [Mangrovicella endophytica]
MTLRLRTALRDEIAEVAALNSRSLNGEIVHRLEHSFSRQVEIFPDLGTVSPMWPRKHHHSALSDRDLLESIDKYSQYIQDCIELLRDRNKG